MTQDDTNKYYRELVDRLPFYKACITSEELSSINDKPDIKYPCILDEDGMKDDDDGIYIDKYDTADYLIDVMNKSGNDAEKMSDEISKFVDYLLK